jgi:phospholipid-binding lipoprotein MlaA
VGSSHPKRGILKKAAMLLILSGMLVLLPGVHPVHSDDTPTAQTDTSEDEDYLDEEPRETIADPLSGLNSAIFEFNDRLYFWVLKPIAQGYRAVVPTPARQSVRNFLHNLGAPIRITNSLLQGKMEDMASEMCRFVYNTSFGVAGLLDPSKEYAHLNPPDKDFGQTLGRFGIGNGIYLVLPFVGPSTLRDTVGIAGDGFFTPLAYNNQTVVNWSLKGGEAINDLSFRIGQYEELKDAAIDPYASFKDGYIQYRKKKIEQQ